MKSLLILLAVLVLIVGCVTSDGKPTEAAYATAVSVVNRWEDGDPMITEADYEAAMEVIRAYEDPNTPWWKVALGGLGALAVTPRGRRIVFGAASALLSGNLLPALASVPAMVGAVSSEPIVKAGEKAKTARIVKKAAKVSPPP